MRHGARNGMYNYTSESIREINLTNSKIIRKVKTMKHTIFALLFFAGGLYAQSSLYQPQRSYLTNISKALIYNKAFVTATADTVDIPLGNSGSVIVFLQTLDSASVIVSYATSFNDTTFTSYIVLDSLKQYSDGSVTKAFDLSPYIGGANNLRVIFAFSALAYSVGTTSATYTASYEKMGVASYPIVNTSSKQWSYTYKIVRPSVAIASYTAAYRIGNNLASYDVYKIASVANGGTGTIQSALLSVDTANVTNATMSLFLFNDTTGLGATSVGDNIAQPFTVAMMNNLVGVINFSLTTGGAGSTSAQSYATPSLRYDTGKSTNLYGILVATAAYKPKSNTGENFIIRLTYTQ